MCSSMDGDLTIASVLLMVQPHTPASSLRPLRPQWSDVTSKLGFWSWELNRAPTSLKSPPKSYPSVTAINLFGPQWSDGTSKLGLVELAGIEPATS